MGDTVLAAVGDCGGGGGVVLVGDFVGVWPGDRAVPPLMLPLPMLLLLVPGGGVAAAVGERSSVSVPWLALPVVGDMLRATIRTGQDSSTGFGTEAGGVCQDQPACFRLGSVVDGWEVFVIL